MSNDNEPDEYTVTYRRVEFVGGHKDGDRMYFPLDHDMDLHIPGGDYIWTENYREGKPCFVWRERENDPWQ